MNNAPLPRLAVVGTSHWHHKFYRETIASKSMVVAYSDPSPAKLKEVKPFYGDTGHINWRDLTDPAIKLDGVVVLTPHDEMMEVSLAFIEMGIPLILEKPGGVNAVQVKVIQDAARAMNVPIVVGFIQRAGPLWRHLQSVGKLQYVTMVHQSGPPERYLSQSPWALEHHHAGGGSFINVGVHYIDLFLQATRAGRVTVRAQSQNLLSKAYDVEDQLTALLEADSGASAVIEIGYIFPKTPGGQHLAYHARGDEAFVTIDVGGRIVRTSTATGASESNQEDVTSGPLTKIRITSCIDQLRHEFAGMPGIADLHRAMQVVDAAYTSALQKKVTTTTIGWR